MTLDAQSGGPTLAVSRENAQPRRGNHAEIIDLVQLPRGTRPTPIAYIEYDEVNACRVMDCEHYHQCLSFAAKVHWRSFHCRQCPHHPARAETGHALVPTEGPLAAVIKLR